MGLVSNLMGGGSGGFLSSAISRHKSKTQSSSSSTGDTGTGGSDMDSYKRGGKVRKTGAAYLHKGERVLTKRQAKRWGGK